MITDSVPSPLHRRRQYQASDAQAYLDLPPAEPLQKLAAALEVAMKTESRAEVRRVGLTLLSFLAEFYGVPPPRLTVLGSRPKHISEGSSYELWGDYTFATQVIRVWMRTAVLGKVTSYRGLLNTILHEFCHHLDVKKFGWPDTPHTRGFFGRIDELYHLALATPPSARRPLVWIKLRGGWRVDWAKLRHKPAAAPQAKRGAVDPRATGGSTGAGQWKPARRQRASSLTGP